MQQEGGDCGTGAAAKAAAQVAAVSAGRVIVCVVKLWQQNG